MFPALLALAAIVSAGTLLGCGGDSGSAEETEASLTPQEAITEIGAVRSGLDQGLAAYRKGDADAAEQAIGDAYLEHFELVEGAARGGGPRAERGARGVDPRAACATKSSLKLP